jgi:hypothetical protein
VSVQTITQAVNALVSGLGQLKDEIKELQQVVLPADDQFIHVMQVSSVYHLHYFFQQPLYLLLPLAFH